MGSEIAAHLAGQNKKVTLIEMRDGIALDLEPRARLALLSLLNQGGVEILGGWRLEKIEDGKVVVVDSSRNRREIKGDSLVLALGLIPNQGLAQALKKNFDEVHIIGDCLKPRKIYQAIHEGAFVGRTI